MEPLLGQLIRHRPLIVFDLETTSLDPSTARIIELAWLELPPGREGLTQAVRLNPGAPIPADATAVHGLTDADVVGCPAFAEVAPFFARLFALADLCGFGIRRFDLPVLAAEFARAGYTFDIAGRAVIDAVQIYHDRERRDLSAAVRHYLSRDHVGAHHAAADVMAAAEVLDAQLDRYPQLPREIGALHRHFSPVDATGCFDVRDGQVVFAFGKYKGQPLLRVAEQDSGYLRWLLRRPLLSDARALIATALAEVWSN